MITTNNINYSPHHHPPQPTNHLLYSRSTLLHHSRSVRLHFCCTPLPTSTTPIQNPPPPPSNTTTPTNHPHPPPSQLLEWQPKYPYPQDHQHKCHHSTSKHQHPPTSCFYSPGAHFCYSAAQPTHTAAQPTHTTNRNNHQTLPSPTTTIAPSTTLPPPMTITTINTSMPSKVWTLPQPPHMLISQPFEELQGWNLELKLFTSTYIISILLDAAT